MEKLNAKETKILQYLANEIQYNEDANDTYVLIPNGFTKSQFTTTCDSLEEKGMVKTAYCEGHILQDARVLDKGQCYLDDIESELEMDYNKSPKEKSLLDNLRVGTQNRRTGWWNNGVYGQIIDLEAKGEFHLIDYIDENTKNPIYLGDINELKNSKIIATGIVGYLLKEYCLNRIKNIEETYRSYEQMCYAEYENKQLQRPEMMHRNLHRTFLKYHHFKSEESKIESSKAIFPFLKTSDVEWIESRINGYREFIEKYKEEMCKPTPFTLDSFLSLYEENGLAAKCIHWMEDKYGLNENSNTDTNRGTKNFRQEEGNIIIGSEDVDFDAFKKDKEPALDEIIAFLKRDNKLEINRELSKILTSFDIISNKVYPLANILSNINMIQCKEERNKKNGNTNANIKNHLDNIERLHTCSQKFLELVGEPGCIHKYQEWDIEWYMCKYVDLYFRFARNLDAILMTFGIDLLEKQKEIGAYLMNPNTSFDLQGVQGLRTISSVNIFYNQLTNRETNIERERNIMEYPNEPLRENNPAIGKKKDDPIENLFAEATKIILNKKPKIIKCQSHWIVIYIIFNELNITKKGDKFGFVKWCESHDLIEDAKKINTSICGTNVSYYDKPYRKWSPDSTCRRSIYNNYNSIAIELINELYALCKDNGIENKAINDLHVFIQQS